MAGELALIAKLDVRLKDFEKRMAQAGVIADKGVRDIESRFARANPRLPAGFSTALKSAFAGVAVEQLVSGIRTAVGTLADMADAAERVGASTKFLQELSYAVQLSGGSADDATAGLEKFAKALSDAGAGSGELGKVFEANGVSIRNAKGELIGTEAALRAYSELIKNAASPQDQLNLATEAFGRSAGPALVNALKDGTDGLDEMAQKAEAAGAVLGGKVFDSASALDDKFTALEISASSWAKALAVAIADFAIPQIEDLIKTVNTVLNILGTDVSTYFNNPTRATGAAMLKAGNGTQQGKKRGALDDFYDAQGDNFDQAPLQVTITKPTVVPGAKTGGGRRGGGRAKTDDLEREIKQIQEKTTELGLEALAVGQSTFEATKAKIAEDLLNAARKDGTEATAAEKAKIEEVATAYAAQTVHLEEVKKAHEDLIAALDDFRNVADAGLSSFVDGIVDGKSAVESLKDALKSMLSTLIQISEKSLLEGLFGAQGSTGGGLLSSLLGAFTGGGSPIGQGGIGHNAKGTANWRGGPTWVGEQGPEIVNLPRGSAVIPNDAVRRSASSGGTVVQIKGGDVHVAGDVSERNLKAIQAAIAHNNKRLAYESQNSWRAG